MSFFKTDEEKAYLQAIDQNYAVISFSPDGTILFANKNFLNALGYSLNEVVGNHHKMFCDSELTNSEEYTNFWYSLNQGHTQTSEFKRIKKNGESIFIQASYSPIKDSSGKVVKVVKFAQDVTQRRLENLDSAGQLDAIGKSQAVIEFNMDGTIIDANDNFLNTLGYSLQEIQGKHHSIFCEQKYKNSSEYKEFWRKLNQGIFDGGEYLRIAKDGSEIWIQATYNPIYDIDGNPFKVVKYATNITERKNLIFKIEDNVNKLTESLNHLSTASTAMTKGAEVTMNGSEDVSIAIAQINDAVSEVSDKIKVMLKSITSVSDQSAQGEKVAKEANVQSQTTTEAIMKLDKESEKIGETIHIITQIAFQTNILSLNAAVEAATAGESGKGFAVVAQEVRNLAARSDEAAKQITSAIDLIQSLVKSSLLSIKNIDKTIKEITSMSTSISSSISEQQKISDALSSTATNASDGVKDVTNTMLDVSASAKSSGKNSKETYNATEELIAVSSDLISILKQLK